MDEHVEREKLLTDICDDMCGFKYTGVCENCRVVALIADAPAADVAPVVHGLWEKEPSSFWRWAPSGAVAVARTTYRCGLCGRGTAVKSNYCPNCGAKMDGDADHADD